MFPSMDGIRFLKGILGVFNSKGWQLMRSEFLYVSCCVAEVTR